MASISSNVLTLSSASLTADAYGRSDHHAPPTQGHVLSEHRTGYGDAGRHGFGHFWLGDCDRHEHDVRHGRKSG